MVLSQHHDHLDTIASRYHSYDQAGYEVVVTMGYSGVASLAYSWNQRITFPAIASTNASLTIAPEVNSYINLKLFIPGMEEVGYEHLTSPFLNTYISKKEQKFPSQNPWQYESTQEAINLIKDLGGLAVVAHPNKPIKYYYDLEDFSHLEIYSANPAFKLNSGGIFEDKNVHFQKVWDFILTNKSSKIWGIAVNDHIGPYRNKLKPQYPEIVDSGKTLVLLKEKTLIAYYKSFEAGSFFAVRDWGRQKNQYPEIQSIEVSDISIRIETNASNIVWKFCDQTLQRGEQLLLQELPQGLNYIRAEVNNDFGTVFIQPFSIQEQ